MEYGTYCMYMLESDAILTVCKSTPIVQYIQMSKDTVDPNMSHIDCIKHNSRHVLYMACHDSTVYLQILHFVLYL